MRGVGCRGEYRAIERGSHARNVGGRRERRIGNVEAWLRFVCPRDHVRHRDITIELHVWWGDEGLRAIVGLARDRDDGLRREFGICFSRRIRGRFSRVERRKIFRWRVVNHLGMIKRGSRNNSRLLREQIAEREERDTSEPVIDDGLQESGPRQSALDEYVGPEISRWRR